MDLRTLAPSDLEAAAVVLLGAFERAAGARGYPPPWPDVRSAAELLSRYREAEPEGVVVAEEGGAVVGVGALRMRGEVATVGPIAVAADGRGIGGGLLDELLGRADEGGAVATRLYADAWNPGAYALYTGRGFSVVDVVAHLERASGPAPRLDGSRGLEVREAAADDLHEIAALDQKLTGHERAGDLARSVRLVARRKGTVVGYAGVSAGSGATLFGPAVAVDVSDLFIVLANLLGGGDAPVDRPVRARLSTAPPAASMAALGLGFRIRELGVVMSRGAQPPARPPQLYSIDPEVL